MPRRLRKSRKKRGSRTYGWGIQGQHRRSGRKGGRGKAGTHKHKWAPPTPKYQEKRGFRSIWTRDIRIINVGELEELIRSLKEKVRDDSGRIILDLKELGYDKLLGKGRVVTPIVIKVRSYSDLALKKIEDIGGKIIEVD
jgi:large subunit ribosomal protein L15